MGIQVTWLYLYAEFEVVSIAKPNIATIFQRTRHYQDLLLKPYLFNHIYHKISRRALFEMRVELHTNENSTGFLH